MFQLNADSNAETERGSLLRQTLEQVIISTLHPRMKISIVIQVLFNDGSVRYLITNTSDLFYTLRIVFVHLQTETFVLVRQQCILY
jgi:hypothetical protein